jgi:hypothetical protein
VVKLGNGSRRFWRQLISCIAAYTLVFHTVWSGVAAAQLAAAVALDDGFPGFALCLHDVDSGPVLPGDHTSENHCKFCVAGGQPFSATALSSPTRIVITDAGKVLFPARDRAVLNFPKYSSSRPRGPPPIA